MALSDPISQFGIHSITFSSRSTGEPFGMFRVLGDAALNLTTSSVKLNGGSSPYAFDSQQTASEGTLSASIKEFPDFLFEKVLGSTVETTASSSTGTVGTITNKLGTSIVASTGLASASSKTGEEASLKSGRYVVKYVTATTVDVFIDTNIDSTRGSDLILISDLLKITATPLTISTSSATEIPNTGIELTGGSGTIAFTATDTAIFEVAHPHGGLSDIIIGATSDTVPEINISLWGQLRDTERYATVEIFRAKSTGGLIMTFPEKGFSITDLTFDLLFDSAQAKVAKLRFSQAS